MISRHILPCGVLFAATLLNVPGQESRKSFNALKQALALSDSQLLRLQKHRPAWRFNPRFREEAARLRGQMLDDSQKTTLAAVASVLDRGEAASLAMDLGIIREEQWPGPTLCLHHPIDAYASSPYMSEIGLSPSQLEIFQQTQRDANKPLWAQVREKAIQRSQLLASGISADSQAIIELGSDINKLQAQIEKPRHDLAMAVLHPMQKAKLAAFENKLQLAEEAIELGLIPAPLKGELVLASVALE